MKALTKFEIAAAILSFAMIFGLGILRVIVLHFGWPEKAVDLAMRTGVVLLFVVFGFCCIGLMLHVFIALQTRIGNQVIPMVSYLAAHETGATLAVWGFLGLGTAIASPFILRDLVGWQPGIGKSQGVLVADIGMTIDQVRQRSTLKFPEPRVMLDGSRMGVRDMVFDYQIGDSAVRFPQSRYYWIETPQNDTHITVMNIGISPRKMPVPELKVFQHQAQSDLLADGWMPGHYLAKDEENVRLWGGKKTAGDGRYWTKGNTLLIFEVSRMDEEVRGEPPGSGEFILSLAIRTKDHDRDLVFEPSAWQP
jgi:hypothetical protein